MSPPSAVARVRRLAPRASDWRHARFGRDLGAGVMVALVALPLALGFGVSSGLGASAGLATAIVAGTVAAVFGGSRVQVSGPTGAMTVVVVPIVAHLGADGVLMVGLIAGLILVGLAIGGIGRFMRYLPISVVEGFTVGIALVIGLQQLPNALGVEVHAEKVLTLVSRALTAWLADPHWTAPAIAFGVAAGVLVLRRVHGALPTAIVAVVVATAGNETLGWGARTVGHVPRGLPTPTLPSVPMGAWDDLLVPAVAIAALAALESLLSATVADAMTVGEQHDPDRELLGQGLANLAAPMFGGIPATAAIARTAVNVRSGAGTRLAAVAHAAVLLVMVLALAPWVERIPLAALAGVLIATAVHMVEVSSLSALMRSTRGDAATVAATAAGTLVFDLVTAVLIGLVVAGFFALRQTARSARLDQVPLDDSDHLDEERRLLDEHIVAYRLDGPLFFGAAHDFLLELADVRRVRVVVLRMSRVSSIDATGARLLAETVAGLERRGVSVMISGVRPQHERVLHHLGVYGRLGHHRHLFASTPEAIDHARLHAHRVEHSSDAERATPADSGRGRHHPRE